MCEIKADIVIFSWTWFDLIVKIWGMLDIKTGDLIAVKRVNSWFWRGVSWVTSSPYTHVGVAIKIDNQVFVAETNPGGAALVMLSSYSSPYDVFSAPVDRQVIKKATFDYLVQYIPYGWGDLFRLGLSQMINWQLPGNSKGAICSEFVSNIYKKANAKMFADSPSLPTPGQVVQLFDAHSFIGEFNVNSDQSAPPD